jgi:drug/metabolite transporter (DMT)-like permease
VETLVAVAAAIGAGLFLAASGILQQREASKRPERGAALVWHLARNRLWCLGVGTAVVSYGLQAIALSFGPLALVQPLIVSELVFAVPISVRLRGLRLRGRDRLTVAMIVVGLTVGIVAAAPHGGDPRQPLGVWLPALLGVAVVATAGTVAARTARGPFRASAYALAGAVVMGTQSALYAATIAIVGDGLWQTFTHWQPYVLIVFSIVGALLIQKAFQAGPLAASSPVIDSTLPLVSIALGIWLFDEQVRTTPLGLAGAATGLALLVAGIVALDLSPVVRREQQIDRRAQQDTADRERDAARERGRSGGPPQA